MHGPLAAATGSDDGNGENDLLARPPLLARPATGRPPMRWRAGRRFGLRLAREDAFRVYAMVLIIVGHTEQALGRATMDGHARLQDALNIVARVAVPLFIFLAGNRLGPRLMKDRGLVAVRSYVRRLAALFLLGSLAYAALDIAKVARHRPTPQVAVEYAAHQLQDPVGLILHGPRGHLWFLPALMFTALFAATLLAQFRLRVFVAAAVGLYVTALLLAPYGPAFGIAEARWGPDWILQSPLFFALGLLVSIRLPHGARARYGWGLVIAGYLMHTLEVWWISTTYGSSPFRLAMLAGTVPLTLGAGLLALRPAARRLDLLVAPLAPLVAGVYLNHMAFVELLRPRPGQFGPWVHAALPILVLLCAFGWARLMRAIAARRRRWFGVRERSAPAPEPE